VSFLQLTRSSQRVTQRAAKIREPAVAKFREPVYFSHFCLSALRTAWGNIYLHCVVLKLWKSDNEEMLCSKVNMQREHTYYASFSSRAPSIACLILWMFANGLWCARDMYCAWRCARWVFVWALMLKKWAITHKTHKHLFMWNIRIETFEFSESRTKICLVLN